MLDDVLVEADMRMIGFGAPLSVVPTHVSPVP